MPQFAGLLDNLSSPATIAQFRASNRAARSFYASGDMASARSSLADAESIFGSMDPQTQQSYSDEIQYTREILSGGDAAAQFAQDQKVTQVAAANIQPTFFEKIMSAVLPAPDPVARGAAPSAISQTSAMIRYLQSKGLPIPVNAGTPQSGRDVTTPPGTVATLVGNLWKPVLAVVGGLWLLSRFRG